MTENKRLANLETAVNHLVVALDAARKLVPELRKDGVGPAEGLMAPAPLHDFQQAVDGAIRAARHRE